MPLPSRSARRIPLVALLLLLPTAAAAQIGGVINKGKKKATDAVVPAAQDSSCTKPEFDGGVLELTPERITAIMKGVEVTQSLAGPSGLTAQTLLLRADSINNERERLLNGKDAQIQHWHEATQAWEQCRSDALGALEMKHQQEMMGRLMAMANSDPEAMQKYQKLSLDIAEKSAGGDTAGVGKMMAELNRMMGKDPAADTAAANAKCGKAPAKPAWLARADSLELVANKLVEDGRAAEVRAEGEGAKAAGMDAVQFRIARERIAAFVNSDGKPGASACYSPREREALKARMKDLKAAEIQ